MLDSDAELKFVANSEVSIPKEKKYLFKYFKTSVQQCFLLYYLAYGDYSRFSEHTGHRCSMRWCQLMQKKLEKVEIAHDTAKKNFDLDVLADIENGKYKWRKQ